jgi:hypothetical protein
MDFRKTVELIGFGRSMLIVERIQKRDLALAGELTDLVNQYRFDTLQELLDQV